MTARDKQGRELYRHFDETDKMLYVGISLSTASRLSQHRRSSQWADDIAYIKIERFPTQALAAEAEKQAIIRENPIWNVVHKPVQVTAGVPASRENSRKSRQTTYPFDVSNVARCLRETTALVARTVGYASHICLEKFPGTHSFVSVILEMKEAVFSEELRLDQLFNAESPEPAPGRRFRLITQTTHHEPGTVVDKCDFTLITPQWLSKLCEECLRRRDDFDQVFERDNQPAIAEFARLFETFNTHSDFQCSAG
ncbi:GIY-YIG nuclease family protein [Pseudomonas sp. BGI-2]|uniref:GIY-YIG nuclease family protein n=1 Tax=Pseudomonas sp. BGI-2 TaxID=2528211 RepID=UPI00103338FE|nr:GIY-YIG nuclease family protein [Pseudomonas sp. BGI-2]TBN36133.1 GIY-YIG nuclease family protein [Pseudomonas sp. BGI-2]